MEIRTEYAIRLTAVRHGKWQTLIQTYPDHATDRKWFEQRVADERAWQADAGRTPDAELVTRTVTIGEWAPETADPGAVSDASPMARGDLAWYEGEPHVITHVFADGRYEMIPGDDPDAVVTYGLRSTFAFDEVTARRPLKPADCQSAADRYAANDR